MLEGQDLALLVLRPLRLERLSSSLRVGDKLVMLWDAYPRGFAAAGDLRPRVVVGAAEQASFAQDSSRSAVAAKSASPSRYF